MKNYKPIYPVVPGDTILELLKNKGMTQKEFCQKTNRPEKWLSEIIRCKARITVESALQFEDVFDIEAEFFLNLQQQFDLCAARGAIALRKLSDHHD